jgi:acyl-[acyl-carrier-protein]-phospholipid O-acyltransferase/long-chain-fatty-acid--[acyl-carrier-protein] ligase
MNWFEGLVKPRIRALLTRLYRVEISGLEHLADAGPRCLVVANHTSFLDAVLLWAFLPGELTFAINTWIAEKRWLRPVFALVRVFPMDPTNPLSSKALVRYLEQDRWAVIFPEGRITVTGSLMKVYDGAGMVADHAQAMVLPIHIDGAQYTPFSRLRGRVRLRWFPRIRMQVLPPRSVSPPPELEGRERRRVAGHKLADLMTEMAFQAQDRRRTLFTALLDAQEVHGPGHAILEDIHRRPLTYRRLVTQALSLGEALAARTAAGERVGILLPNMTSTVATMLGLSAFGRVPAFLNFTVGAFGMRSAVEIGGLRRVITSRAFIEAGRLGPVVDALGGVAEILWLEDLAAALSPLDRLTGYARALWARRWYARLGAQDPDAPAVILFTSGSEGTPKGVVLSHANLLANRAQLASRIDFAGDDVVLNALPMFHSFGLTGGTLLPLFCGMKTFLYPSPVHYRIVPEVSYDIDATIMFGTNTLLAGYAKHAHPYDFYSIRYVFAGAEKLKEETRRIWSSKFGVRILEGYGATETSPALAANTPMENREGTVGRFLPGIEYHLEPVPGVPEGGRLSVRGPNVMRGYLLHGRPGELVPPVGPLGEGWYDTGDIVAVDAEGYCRILGRVKRFAKVAGEMVSLGVVEDLAAHCWPRAMHAAVAVTDSRKGEQVLLLTTAKEADRAALSAAARDKGIAEINVAKQIIVVAALPLLGTGKIDYPKVAELADGLAGGSVDESVAEHGS